MICKILRLVVNTFNADEKYSLLNRDNLTQPIHMVFSQKQKAFSGTLFPFLEFILNLKHFQKNMTLIRHVFPKVQYPKNVVRLFSKKSYFGGPFHKQHGKLLQTLLESERQQLYHIFS